MIHQHYVLRDANVTEGTIIYDLLGRANFKSSTHQIAQHLLPTVGCKIKFTFCNCNYGVITK